MNREVYALPPAAVKAADSGKFFEAIKVVRKDTGLDLKAAKDLVDTYVKNNSRRAAAI